MRRLTQHDRDDRGVVTIFVVVAMMPLLLLGAALRHRRRPATSSRPARPQNSADATALAVATDCAAPAVPLAGLLDRTARPTRTIDVDHAARAAAARRHGHGDKRRSPTVDPRSGERRRRDPIGHGEVGRRSATATTVPITISDCEFRPATARRHDDVTLAPCDDPAAAAAATACPAGLGGSSAGRHRLPDGLGRSTTDARRQRGNLIASGNSFGSGTQPVRLHH